MSLLDPLPVSGYTKQSQTTLDLVNANKQAEERVLREIDRLQKSGEGDPRWLAIARTDIEKGFMALNRAIFQPHRVSLPSDDETPKSSAWFLPESPT